MARTADAFNTFNADIQSVSPDSLQFFEKTGAPADTDLSQVPTFQDTYVRHEFHPLVSACLWVVDRIIGKKSAQRAISQ